MATLKPVDEAKRARLPALYGSLSISQKMEKEELERLDQMPGPGAYFGPESQGFSAIGGQRFSKFRTEPTRSFAKTGWDSWKRVFITKGHRPADAGTGVPPPNTYFKDISNLSTSLKKFL